MRSINVLDTFLLSEKLCFFSLAEIRWTRSSESETTYRDADALHAVLEQQKGKAMIPVHYPASELLPEVGLVFCCRPRLQILARFKRSDGAISLIRSCAVVRTLQHSVLLLGGSLSLHLRCRVNLTQAFGACRIRRASTQGGKLPCRI
jgi:hypothetical protein